MNNTTTSILLAVLALGLSAIPALAETEILSPFKQYSSGIPIDEIQCNGSKILMESPRNTPACVTENSVDRLLQRGFNVLVITVIASPIEELDEITSNHTAETFIKTPILNPTNIDDLIPQDFILDYTLKIPVDNPDDFVQKLATLHDDEITNKFVHSSGARYDTQRGTITIYDDYVHDFKIKYTFFGKDRIHPDKAEETTMNLLRELGIVLDGTEMFKYEPAQTSSFTYWIVQQKDGFIIDTNQIKTTFDAGYTFFHIGNWNTNVLDFDMYDFNKSKENAIKYLSTIDELVGENCNVKYKKSLDDSYKSISILNGYPVYKIYSGTCQVELWDGHYYSYYTVIDGLSGEPLFARSGMML